MLYTAVYMQLQEVHKFSERNYTWSFFKFETGEKNIFIMSLPVCLSVLVAPKLQATWISGMRPKYCQ